MYHLEFLMNLNIQKFDGIGRSIKGGKLFLHVQMKLLIKNQRITLFRNVMLYC